MPIAAVETLAELIARSDSTTTTTELFTLLRTASSELAAASFNPISLSSGTSLFVSPQEQSRDENDTLMNRSAAPLSHSATPTARHVLLGVQTGAGESSNSSSTLRVALNCFSLQVERAREFVKGSGRCRELISANMADFIVDGNVSRDAKEIC